MTLALALQLHQGASDTATASLVVVAIGLSIPVGRRQFARDCGCVIKDPSPPRAGQLVRCESVVEKAARVTQVLRHSKELTAGLLFCSHVIQDAVCSNLCMCVCVRSHAACSSAHCCANASLNEVDSTWSSFETDFAACAEAFVCG